MLAGVYIYEDVSSDSTHCQLTRGNIMKKTMKLLAVVGVCSAGIAFLAGIFNFGIVAIIGFILLFGCTISVLVLNVITGYNPVES